MVPLADEVGPVAVGAAVVSVPGADVSVEETTVERVVVALVGPAVAEVSGAEVGAPVGMLKVTPAPAQSSLAAAMVS
jgi:hypothetical protein